MDLAFTQVEKINSGTTIHVVCLTEPIPCLLILWWFLEPENSKYGIDPQSQNIPFPASEELIINWYIIQQNHLYLYPSRHIIWPSTEAYLWGCGVGVWVWGWGWGCTTKHNKVKCLFHGPFNIYPRLHGNEMQEPSKTNVCSSQSDRPSNLLSCNVHAYCYQGHNSGRQPKKIRCTLGKNGVRPYNMFTW